MEVFHYCAERLKNVQLFSTCSDEAILNQAQRNQEGSVYNDFDFNPSSIVELENFSDFESVNMTNPVHPARVNVSQEAINDMFLLADEEDTDRWTFDSELFDCTADPNSSEYMHKVYRASKYDWDDLPIYNDHIQRY